MGTFQSTDKLAGVSVLGVRRVLSKNLSHKKVGWVGWSVNDLGKALGIESATALDLAMELVRLKLVFQMPETSRADLFGNERVFHTTLPGERMSIGYWQPPEGQDAVLYAEQAAETIAEEMRICEMAEECVSLMAVYRRQERHEVSVLPAGGFFAHGQSCGSFSLFQIGLRKPLEWLNEIYKQDLAVMSDTLVLGILSRIDERSLVVAAVKQGARCSLRLVPALAVLSNAGSWQLKWKGFGATAVEALNSVKSPQHENPGFFDAHYMQGMVIRMSSHLKDFGRYAFGSSVELVESGLPVKEDT